MKRTAAFLSVLNPERTRLLELANLRKKFTRAKGVHLFDEEGTAHVDFTSQFGVHAFGHNPDFLWEELASQQHICAPNMIQPFETTGAVALAQLLIDVAPGSMTNVTFANSGAECVEAALKMARASTGRNGVLSTDGSFHGKTMGAALATGNHIYSDGFFAGAAGFDRVPFDDLVALEERLQTEEYAAFIVEPIQGEGGMNTPSDGYLKACERFCRQYGTLLVVDEVQTGLGRTGYLFACERDGVEPDIVLLAKALGGGLFPIGAVISNARSWSSEFGQRHSTTFANNHLACHIGAAVVRRLTTDPTVLANVREQGDYLFDGLHALVKRYPRAFLAASGRGLMQGIKLRRWSDEDGYMVAAASDLGLTVPIVASYLVNEHRVVTAPTLSCHDTLRIQPSLIVEKTHIDGVLTALSEVGALVERGRFSTLFDVCTRVPRLAAAAGSTPGEQHAAASRAAAPELPVTRPASVVRGEKKLGTFAFFIHPTTEKELLESLPGGAAAYEPSAAPELCKWFEGIKQVYSSATQAYYLPYLRSKQGGYVDGWLISSFLLPHEMLKLSAQEKRELLDSYVASAKNVGATIVGLGAFTAVISKSGDLVKGCGIPVTTGNAYTALSCVEAVREICGRLGTRLGDLHAGIVGARGSVGRLMALEVAGSCKELTLIGNPRNPAALTELETVAGELCWRILTSHPHSVSPLYAKLAQAGLRVLPSGSDRSGWSAREALRSLYQHLKAGYETRTGAPFPIHLSILVSESLPTCEVVLSATSNGAEFIRSENLQRGAIICDAARPSDLAANIREERKDLFVFNGGEIRFPAAVRFGRANILGFEPGINLACLAETVALAMARVTQDYSIGGTSSLEEARHVYRMATDHGFEPHVPYDIGADAEMTPFAAPAQRAAAIQ
jgi:acetylornithine/succinyldiaminopimelate/putrescine aminotransferase/predicted amino acid dehydrogenase